MNEKLTVKNVDYRIYEWDVASFLECKAANNNMELGNICIIGEEKDISALANHIISCFEKHNHHLDLITTEEFFRAGRSNKLENQNYLIHIDPDQIGGNRVGVITDYCNTKFISRSTSLDLVTPSTSIENNVKYNRIVKSLGGDFTIRKIQIASLKQNEFLVIGKNNEKILCLKGGVENE